MGSCFVKKNTIIVTKVTIPETDFYSYSQKNPSKGIETIQTSNCLKMHSSKSKIQWNSKIQKNLELSGIIPNYSELYLKANQISDKIKISINVYLNKEKETKKLKLKDFMINTPADNFICPICDDVLLNPIHCVKCNLFICEHCFNETNNNICEHVIDTEQNEYYKYITSSLSNECFKCINQKYGCNTDIQYETYYFDEKTKIIVSLHDKICEFHTEHEQCTNPSCSFIGSIDELTHHLQICKFKRLECHFCKQILSIKDYHSHQCNKDKHNFLALPIRYCRCGERLIWRTSRTVQCYKEKICSSISYYYCPKCAINLCDNHAPAPISRLCGCEQKLKGGLISRCSICGGEGIGWYCNECEKGVKLCESCLNEQNEVGVKN